MDNIFDGIYDYEESRWQEGFDAGAEDANRRSYFDGVVFGVDKGLEKGHAMGVLRGRALVWSLRITKGTEETAKEEKNKESDSLDWTKAIESLERTAQMLEQVEETRREFSTQTGANVLVSQLEATTEKHCNATNAALDSGNILSKPAPNQRLRKHIDALLALTDPSTLDYGNSDQAVEEWDDRYKRAAAKAKVIEKIMGEAVQDDRDVQSAAVEKLTRRQKGKPPAISQKNMNVEDF